MNWISDNLQILATLGSALAVYAFLRIGAKRDVEALEKRIDRIEHRMDKLEHKMDKLEHKMDRVEERLQSIDTRLTRLEGRFDERGYWEAREFRKTGTYGQEEKPS